MESSMNIDIFLAPIRNIDFKMYSLNSIKQFSGEEIYLLTDINNVDYLKNIPNNFYWSFNNKSLGEYCREFRNDVENLKIEIKKHLYQDKDWTSEESNVIKNNLNIIIKKDRENQKDIIDKFLINKFLPQRFTINFFKDISINKAYNFRTTEINNIIKILDYIGTLQARKAETEKNFGLSEAKVEVSTYPKRYAAHKAAVSKPDRAEIDLSKEELLTPREENQEHSLGSKAFCWNQNRNLIKDLMILHTYLRDYDFIEKDTSINSLKAAFSCGYIDKPLEIKWTKKVKGKDSKGLLFHFIDQLEHLNLIKLTYQNFELFNKLNYVFCDSTGESFKNLEVSKSQWLNQRKLEKTPQEVQLDRILYTLLYSKRN
jgi:hypothetical protein